MEREESIILATDVTQTTNSVTAIQGIVCQEALNQRDKLLLLLVNEQIYIKKNFFGGKW